MLRTTRVFSAGLFLLGAISLSTLGGCGVFVPEKNPLSPDHITDPQSKASSEGTYESLVIANIYCEVATGLAVAYHDLRAEENGKLAQLQWLHDWGTSITVTITVEDQSGLTPGLSLTTPFENKIFTFPKGGNVTSAQSFNLGLGASGTAAATRTETIQFTYLNKELIKKGNEILQNNTLQKTEGKPCQEYQRGVMIQSDLKIWQFIYDKIVIATSGNATSAEHATWPLYNTFTEDITFVATLGGSVTPTWKLAQVSANTSGSLLSATRTNNNQLTITIGPVQTKPSDKKPAQLSSAAQAQHNVRVQAGANASALGQ